MLYIYYSKIILFAMVITRGQRKVELRASPEVQRREDPALFVDEKKENL
jgi:hypothetical protein